jgi:NAD kinase
MTEMKSLPKLAIFRDMRKQGVSEAIDEFLCFAKGKAEIVASYGIEDLKQTCTADLSPRCRGSEKCDFAIVFGGDGIISTARNVRAALPVVGVNVGKLPVSGGIQRSRAGGFFPALKKGRSYDR